MTARQFGAYWLICTYSWHSTPVGHTLNDPATLRKLGRLSEDEWREDGPVILAAFDTSNPKVLIQKRIVKEWKKQQVRRDQQVIAGKASAKLRLNQHQHTNNERSTHVEHPFNSSSSTTSSSSFNTTNGKRAKAVFGEDEMLLEVENLFGPDEMKQNGGFFRSKIRENAARFNTVLADTRSALKENRITKNPAAFFIDAWGRFE